MQRALVKLGGIWAAKKQNQQALVRPADSPIIQHMPLNSNPRKLLMMGYRHGPKRACQRNIRPLNPLIERGFADAKPWGPVCFIPNPGKRASIVPHDRLGVRLAPSHAGVIFMRGGNPNPTQNNRGKQGMSVHTPAKRLLGDGPQTPEKARQRRPFHRPLRAAARPADASKHEGHTFFQPVKSPVLQRPQGRVAAPPVERLARQR